MINKYYKQAGIILLLLIFLSIVFVFRGKIFRLIFYAENQISAGSFVAVSKNFRGKINLTCGKIGSGNKIIAASQNTAPNFVKIFSPDGKTFQSLLMSDLDSGFNIAIGNVDDDKKNEIILGQISGKSSIYIYKQKNKKFSLVHSFEAFGGLPVGVNLALGDVNGDGKQEVIAGQGEGGEPQVKIFEVGQAPAPAIQEIGNFYAFHPKMIEGVKVAALNYDGEKGDEIVTLTNLESDTQFKVYKFDKIFSLQNVTRVYDKKTKIPANLLTADVNDDGKKEIIIVPQKKLGQEIKIFGYGKEIEDSWLYDFMDRQGGENFAVCDLSGNDKEEIIVDKGGSEIKIFYR